MQVFHAASFRLKILLFFSLKAFNITLPGKTTFLQHALMNEKGKKFGLVVNDVATVNVDSKLIRKQSLNEFDGVDTLELQNG